MQPAPSKSMKSFAAEVSAYTEKGSPGKQPLPAFYVAIGELYGTSVCCKFSLFILMQNSYML